MRMEAQDCTVPALRDPWVEAADQGSRAGASGSRASAARPYGWSKLGNAGYASPLRRASRIAGIAGCRFQASSGSKENPQKVLGSLEILSRRAFPRLPSRCPRDPNRRLAAGEPPFACAPWTLASRASVLRMDRQRTRCTKHSIALAGPRTGKRTAERCQLEVGVAHTIATICFPNRRNRGSRLIHEGLNTFGTSTLWSGSDRFLAES